MRLENSSYSVSSRTKFDRIELKLRTTVEVPSIDTDAKRTLWEEIGHRADGAGVQLRVREHPLLGQIATY
jgi:hypothetical protein